MTHQKLNSYLYIIFFLLFFWFSAKYNTFIGTFIDKFVYKECHLTFSSDICELQYHSIARHIHTRTHTVSKPLLYPQKLKPFLCWLLLRVFIVFTMAVCLRVCSVVWSFTLTSDCLVCLIYFAYFSLLFHIVLFVNSIFFCSSNIQRQKTQTKC